MERVLLGTKADVSAQAFALRAQGLLAAKVTDRLCAESAA
jgi:hypothetical protein